MRTLFVSFVLLLFVTPTAAQSIVYDPANVAESGVIGTIHHITADLHGSIDRWFKRLSRSYWVFADVERFRVESVVRWRTFQPHIETTQLSTKAFMQALNAGDENGLVTAAALEPLVALDTEAAVSPGLQADLAVHEWADSALRGAIDATGTIRGNRRPERQAIAALEDDVVRLGNSTTMTAGTLSAAAVIRARQHQARGQLALARLDLALVETARLRTNEAAAMELRLAQPLSTDLATGTTNALRGWRMP